MQREAWHQIPLKRCQDLTQCFIDVLKSLKTKAIQLNINIAMVSMVNMRLCAFCLKIIRLCINTPIVLNN